jgi:hypothetical protein
VKNLSSEKRHFFSYHAPSVVAAPPMLHFVKSISSPHPAQTWALSNSSEKISFSFPQLGHLQSKDFRLLKDSKPGQCCGVVIFISLG